MVIDAGLRRHRPGNHLALGAQPWRLRDFFEPAVPLRAAARASLGRTTVRLWCCCLAVAAAFHTLKGWTTPDLR